MASRLAFTTAYSLLWGTMPIAKLFARLKVLGVTKTAITDRDNLFAYPACREEAQKVGIELVCGAQLTEKTGSIFVFVQNQRGYERLCFLITKRNLDGSFSYTNALQEGSQGLVLASSDPTILHALSGTGSCLYGAITTDSLSAIKTASDLGLQLIALDNARFLSEEDREVHRVLRAIALHKTLGTLQEQDQCRKGGVLLDQVQWEAYFAPWPEAMALAETLAPYDPFPSTLLFPDYPVQEGSAATQLFKRVLEGAEKRYGEVNDAIMQRIRYELDIIEQKGFSPYFLTMHDIVNMSSRTCGRGSGAASIVSYCLFITNVDPIAHHLYFERFLSPSRIDPPDIDVDFAWDERDGVFAQVFQRFGISHCARVANHNCFRFRSALRETARCHALSDSQITEGERILFQQGIQGMEDPLWQSIVRIATKLEGLPKEISMHSGGLVITAGKLTDHVPLLNSSQGYPLLSWEKEGTEQAGFVKIDLLGNRSLAVIRDTLSNLQEEGIFIDERTWDPSLDRPTIEALARGDSLGVFYIESPAMRQLQKKTGRGDFEHIVIHSSIIRPAANKYINEYVQRLKGKQWEPLHPRLAYILDETYGILCYQEDVSKTAVALAGFDEAAADHLRKIIAKKAGGEKLQHYKERFFAGCEANGVSQPVIQTIWEMMLSFDGYSFCKPHSASYAMVSFQSAYLRVHYSPYFMAAVLTNQGGYYHSQAYISEARRMGITMVGPDLNLSRSSYHAKANTLIIGLMAIGNLDRKAQQEIVEERQKHGPYASLKDAAGRLCLGRDDWVALVRAGACDSLAQNFRRSEQLRTVLTTRHTRQTDNQMELFSFPAPEMKKTVPTRRVRPNEEELLCEYATLGFLRTYHPLVLYRTYLEGVQRVMAYDLGKYVDRHITLVGLQITNKQVLTKEGADMSFISFEDESALYETVLFPDVYKRHSNLLHTNWPLLVFGMVKNDQGALIVEVQYLKKLGS